MGTAGGILALALIVSTIVVWTQARKTDAANRSHHAYIIETFPLLDTLAMDSLRQATMVFAGKTDPESREQAIEVYQLALAVYKDASELPPADLESPRSSRGPIAASDSLDQSSIEPTQTRETPIPGS